MLAKNFNSVKGYFRFYFLMQIFPVYVGQKQIKFNSKFMKLPIFARL